MKIKVVDMMRARRGLTVSLLAGLALLLAACSPSAAKLTDAGNEAFAKQAYEEALQAYAEAQAKSPELVEPYYNSANVLYREGKYEEALKTLQQAAQMAQTDQAVLAAHSHFNAGNSAFNNQGWEPAIESYRQALLRDPSDMDAKHNLELALQQMQQQQDQQNQDQQNKDQQNQDQQNQDQQNQDQQNKDQQNQDQQNQDQQNKDQQNQDQQNQDQQQNGQGQQDQQNQEQKQDRQDQSQEGQGQQDQDQRDQQAQGRPQAGNQQEGEHSSGTQPAPGQRMTQDQARQLLAAIADKSETLQGRLGQFLRVRSRPPVQDW